MLNFLIVLNWNNQTFILDPRLISNMEHPKQTIMTKNANIYLDKKRNKIQGQLCKRLAGPIISPALRAARTEQPAVAEMPTHPFVQPAIRLKP